LSSIKVFDDPVLGERIQADLAAIVGRR